MCQDHSTVELEPAAFRHLVPGSQQVVLGLEGLWDQDQSHRPGCPISHPRPRGQGEVTFLAFVFP